MYNLEEQIVMDESNSVNSKSHRTTKQDEHVCSTKDQKIKEGTAHCPTNQATNLLQFLRRGPMWSERCRQKLQQVKTQT